MPRCTSESSRPIEEDNMALIAVPMSAARIWAGFVYQCCAAARRLRHELSLLPARHGERPLAPLYNLQDDNARKESVLLFRRRPIRCRCAIWDRAPRRDNDND